MSAPRDRLLELGHSRLKAARLGAEGGPVDVEMLDVARFARWLAGIEFAPSTRFWLAAVPAAGAVAPLTDALRRRGAAWTRIGTGQPPLDVAPAYPGLGVDRWLALQAARRRIDGAFCLVDAGTATTIDLVDAAGRHLGGWILPGREAARGGLLARAPVLRRDVSAIDTLAPATETGRAIERGLLLQQVGAVERALAEARALPGVGEPALVMTGGDAASLQSRVHGARVEPDLVLEGLAMAAQRANGA